MTTDERPLADTSMTEDVMDILIACLTVISQYGPRCDKFGICTNIDFEIEELNKGRRFDISWWAVREKFSELAQKWPLFSGNRDYPVPHQLTPDKAYTSRIPKWEGQYGELRLSLLSFVLTEATRTQALRTLNQTNGD